jgi:hypothetical protein
MTSSFQLFCTLTAINKNDHGHGTQLKFNVLNLDLLRICKKKGFNIFVKYWCGKFHTHSTTPAHCGTFTTTAGTSPGLSFFFFLYNYVHSPDCLVTTALCSGSMVPRISGSLWARFLGSCITEDGVRFLCVWPTLNNSPDKRTASI